MSAIAGLIQAPLPADAQSIITRMCNIQRHRGPDWKGVVQDGNACLGQRLLDTVGIPHDASNPMADAGTTIMITSDSAIYNAEELQNKLKGQGLRFKTSTDNELLLRLYEVYGVECLQYLRGDFAFAVWDCTRQTLFLARDRFGIRPLFYSHSPYGPFVFASELKALIKSGRVERTVDLEAIYHYLFFSFFHQPQTPFKHIKSLLPAHYLLFNLRDGSLMTSPYWDVPYSMEKIQDENLLIHEGRLVLEEAVELQAKKAKSIGVSLSGGLDSSTIAATLAKLGYPVKTYTCGFQSEGEKFNEFHFASILARKIGSEHSEVIMTAKDIINDLPQLVWHFDTPTAGIILPYSLAKVAKRAGVDVTFRGDGAHSAFEAPAGRNVISLHKFFWFLNFLPEGLRRYVCRQMEIVFARLEPRARNSSSDMAALIRLISSYLQTITGRRNLDLMFSERERKRLFIEPFWKKNPGFRETSDLVLETMNRGPSPNIFEQLMYEEYHRFCDQALAHITSVNAAFSIDGRQPYLDHKLVEFFQCNIPFRLRTMTIPNKYILNKIAEPILPPQITRRAQHGFAQPFHTWLQKDMKPLLDDVFSEDTIKRRGIFRYDEIRKLFEYYYRPNRPYVSWRKLWCFVILEIWFRLYLDPQDIECPTFIGQGIILQ